MVDSLGPGTLRQCNTIGLSNLGDTEGFGKPGTYGKLYTLHLQDNVYKRKEVTFTGNLEDLSDVDVSRLLKNTSYNIILNDDKKWTMVEANIEWLLNIVITPPYVMTGKTHNLTKIINSGIVLGAYTPSKRKRVVVSPLPENLGHMLYSRPA